MTSDLRSDEAEAGVGLIHKYLAVVYTLRFVSNVQKLLKQDL